MTNEQAITVLNMIDAHGDLAIKAKELAIEALKKQILQKVKNQFISHNGVITCFEEFVCPVCGYRISDKDLGVMIEDCKHQATFEMYGDEKIDKPGWIEWENQLKAERERRKNAKQ